MLFLLSKVVKFLKIHGFRGTGSRIINFLLGYNKIVKKIIRDCQYFKFLLNQSVLLKEMVFLLNHFFKVSIYLALNLKAGHFLLVAGTIINLDLLYCLANCLRNHYNSILQFLWTSFSYFMQLPIQFRPIST